MTVTTYSKIYEGEKIDCLVTGEIEKFSKWERFRVYYRYKGWEVWEGGHFNYSSKASAQKAARNMIKNS